MIKVKAMSKFIKIKRTSGNMYINTRNIHSVTADKDEVRIHEVGGGFFKITEPAEVRDVLSQLDCLIPRDLSEQIADAELLNRCRVVKYEA